MIFWPSTGLDGLLIVQPDAVRVRLKSLPSAAFTATLPPDWLSVTTAGAR